MAPHPWIALGLLAASLIYQGSIREKVTKIYLDCMAQRKDLPDYEEHTQEWFILNQLKEKHGYYAQHSKPVSNTADKVFVAFLVVMIAGTLIWGFWPDIVAYRKKLMKPHATTERMEAAPL